MLYQNVQPEHIPDLIKPQWKGLLSSLGLRREDRTTSAETFPEAWLPKQKQRYRNRGSKRETNGLGRGIPESHYRNVISIDTLAHQGDEASTDIATTGRQPFHTDPTIQDRQTDSRINSSPVADTASDHQQKYRDNPVFFCTDTLQSGIIPLFTIPVLMDNAHTLYNVQAGPDCPGHCQHLRMTHIVRERNTPHASLTD